MHHYEHPDGHINFNPDPSGEVQIVNSRGEEFWVSRVLLVNLVANYKEYILPRMAEAKARFEAIGVASLDQAIPEVSFHSSK